MLQSKMSTPSPSPPRALARSHGHPRSQANKHVYVEKPSSHNCREGELLVAAQKKIRQVCTGRRPAALLGLHHRTHQEDPRRHDRHALPRQGLLRQPARLHGPRQGRSRSSRTRLGSLAGPAPRSEYKDNIHPYNWHWLRRFGTGETLNNGTHEVDICRWALGLEFPNSVSATGGKFQDQDDWEFYDTLQTSFGYSNATITWTAIAARAPLLGPRPWLRHPRHQGLRRRRPRRLRCLRLATASRSTSSAPARTPAPPTPSASTP